MAAVEGDLNASVTTQLVKQKAKWAAIEDGDHNASITTHRKNRKQCGNHKATKSYKEQEQHQDHRLRTVSRINYRGWGEGGVGCGGRWLKHFYI